MNCSPPSTGSQTHDGIVDAIISEIAAHEDLPPEEVTPTFYEVIDPDALARLFQPTSSNSRHGRVVIPYNGYTVTVTYTDTITVTLASEEQHETPAQG